MLSKLPRGAAPADGGDPRHGRDLSQLTDAQLHAIIMWGLRKDDPALAVRYAEASADERTPILEQIIAEGEQRRRC